MPFEWDTLFDVSLAIRSPYERIAMRAIGPIGRPLLLFDAGSLKPRLNRRNAGIDLLLRQLTE
jgi:hypothetical protein